MIWWASLIDSSSLVVSALSKLSLEVFSNFMAISCLISSNLFQTRKFIEMNKDVYYSYPVSVMVLSNAFDASTCSSTCLVISSCFCLRVFNFSVSSLVRSCALINYSISKVKKYENLIPRQIVFQERLFEFDNPVMQYHMIQ
jgi:hypothetical protein